MPDGSCGSVSAPALVTHSPQRRSRLVTAALKRPSRYRRLCAHDGCAARAGSRAQIGLFWSARHGMPRHGCRQHHARVTAVNVPSSRPRPLAEQTACPSGYFTLPWEPSPPSSGSARRELAAPGEHLQPRRTSRTVTFYGRAPALSHPATPVTVAVMVDIFARSCCVCCYPVLSLSCSQVLGVKQAQGCNGGSVSLPVFGGAW